MPRPSLEIMQEFVEVCHRIYDRRYVAAMDGNISMRLKSGNILCTPHGVCKGDILAQDLIILDAAGALVEGTRGPTTEMPLHFAYLDHRPDIGAVIHAHPVHATALAVAGRRIPDCVFPEVMLGMGAVPLAPYGTPSTRELPDSIAPFIAKHDVILLQNHGVVVAGATLRDAYFKLEKLEHTAKIVIAAAAMGGAKPLSRENVEALLAVAGEVYGVDMGKKQLTIDNG